MALCLTQSHSVFIIELLLTNEPHLPVEEERSGTLIPVQHSFGPEILTRTRMNHSATDTSIALSTGKCVLFRNGRNNMSKFHCFNFLIDFHPN